jgi:acyl dehydratase
MGEVAVTGPGGSAARPLAIGDELAPLVKELTLERLVAYGGPAKNLHSDLEAARAEGFPSVVAWGMLSVTFVSELLAAHFGLGWARGGRLSVSLVKPIFAGNRVTVRARVTSAAADGAGWRYGFDVWCETDGGEKVLVGEASARAVAAADG